MKIDFGTALRRARGCNPSEIGRILAAAGAELGARDVVVYLVDFGQTVLEPLPDDSTHAELPKTEPVGASMVGRAFVDQRVVTVERPDGVRVWAPILEGSDRTGVVAVTLPDGDEDRLRGCEELGLLAGYLIAAQARGTDVYNLYRRRRSMSLAASMQWDILPPLVLRSGAVSVAGLVEPAYEVGGDCFDYAANGAIFDFAVMDAMGHGVRSAVIASLAIGCYRHGRRESMSLEAMHAELHSTLEDHIEKPAFATGVLGRLDTDAGRLTWSNAGHPLPLLVRNGQVLEEMYCPPSPPWGLLPGDVSVATTELQPGDSVLLYTDGVTGVRDGEGGEMGVERLIDLTGRSASDQIPPEEVVRHLVNSVLEHRGSTDLNDDATVVMVRWDGPPNT
ncbi:MAG TPA: PP2C family protein-serine/threonine phosphatase [Acidimicrobiales bacterium]|nr:PP2C family protein-serine/threonine phosphatase [Acidimicrobiales bacterium]